MTYQRKEQLSEDVTLYLGDCREVLPTLGKVDAVVTDPPYGIGFGSKHTSHSKNRGVILGEWDNEIPDLSHIIDFAPNAIIWGGERFNLPIRRRWLTWVKPDAAPTFASTEFAWTSQDKPAKHFVCAVGSVNHERVPHPTQKPLALMRWSLGFLPDALMVLDPFMGSGTTGVACVQLGRKFIGIELESGYFDIACRRIGDELKRPRLPLDPPKTAAEEAQQALSL